MPSNASPLWTLSATDTAAAIRRRALSCREVTESALARIRERNPRLNALAEVLDEAALAAADAADRQVAQGLPLGPLHGVPVTTKINVDQAGLATTNGSVALRGLIAREDAPVVANLRRAGAILVGRSNTATYSVRWFTDNAVHGRTLNPWHADSTPGGSSGGAAVAVATGMGAIAHGNDMGGSIRYPAYCCGVAGLRPTAGRIPAHNPSASAERGIAAQLMSVQGPLARSVADLRLALAAMARFDARDPNCLPLPSLPAASAAPPGLRVAVCSAYPGVAADPAVAAAVQQAAAWLRAAGYAVEEARPPALLEGAALWRLLSVEDGRRGISAAIADHGDAAMRTSQAHMEHGIAPLDRDACLDMLAQRFTLARQWAEFLDRFPLLLMPVSWHPPAPQDADAQDWERFRALLDAQSPLLATACLGLPGVSVPTGLHGATPMGVQLVAARLREDLLLDAAQAIEDAAGFVHRMLQA
jgi:amidase